MSVYRFNRLKVLIVDDNPHMRTLIATVLHAFGATQIHEAADAELGWKTLRDAIPDVVFVDWALGGSPGIDLVKRIRTAPDSPYPYLPVIMLTGHTQMAYVNKARDAGVNEFLAKPVSVKAILTRLVSVIEQPRPFVRTPIYFGPCRRRSMQDNYDGPERREQKLQAASA